MRRDLDVTALPHYLSFFAVPEPYSLVRGVRRLPAGHTLTVSASGAVERQYWDCAVVEEEDRGAAAYRDEVEALLDDAVRRRLVSDVPLGVLLSGGIDSGLMATLAARHLESPLRTFTLGFGVPGADEREPARATAGALGTDHAEDTVGPQAVAETLPRLLEAYDEPGQSLLQTHFVSQLARRDVTVALSGLGGDELFSSYPSHVAANLLARFDALPAPVRAPALAAGRLAPGSRMGRATALAELPSDDRASRRLLHQTDAGLRRDLLAPELRNELDLEAPVRHLAAHYERAAAHDPLNRMLYVYLKTYLVDELLRATDAMSMLNSLELRTPFLDYRLVERAMAMPAQHKMRLRKGKLLLRDIAEGTAPISASGHKRGFSPPLMQWLRGELRESIRDALSAASMRERGIFDPVAAESLATRFVNGDDRLVQPVMMLYCFETWARRWLDGNALAPASAGNGAAAAAERDLSVIIVNWNTVGRLRDCLASLQQHLVGVDHEVIVIDNASSDGSADMVAEQFPAVRLVRNDENVGFGRANNQAMRMARGRWFLLLNSDTVLVDDSVARLIATVRDEPGLGVAQCKLVFDDERLQHSVYRFPSLRLALFEDLGLYKLVSRKRAGEALLSGYWDYGRERDVDWVAGAFMLIPRTVFDLIGGFDERLFMYGEDLEWCYRIRDAGWRVRYYPDASIKHFDHVSSEQRWGDERIDICLRRQRDIYRERTGPARSAALSALRIAGAALRTAYYSARVAVGPRSDSYRDHQRYAAHSLRALLPVRNRR